MAYCLLVSLLYSSELQDGWFGKWNNPCYCLFLDFTEGCQNISASSGTDEEVREHCDHLVVHLKEEMEKDKNKLG